MKKFTLLLLCILNFSCSEVNDTENLRHKVELLNSENDSLKNEIQQIRSSIDSLKIIEVEDKNYWFNPDYDASSLTEHGIENPQSAIKNSLRQHLNLIPLDGVLGGTMRFGNIQLLGEKWIIADYSDGHIQGRSFFLYKLNDQGEVNFSILDSAEY